MISAILIAAVFASAQGQATNAQTGRGRAADLTTMSISDRDYPREPFEAGIEGDVTIRYVVGPDGRVADCFVERSTGSPAFGELACMLWYQRARFRPALDAAGRPTTETRRQEHYWRLTDRGETFPPGAVAVTLECCLAPANIPASDPRCRRRPARQR